MKRILLLILLAQFKYAFPEKLVNKDYQLIWKGISVESFPNGQQIKHLNLSNGFIDNLDAIPQFNIVKDLSKRSISSIRLINVVTEVLKEEELSVISKMNVSSAFDINFTYETSKKQTFASINIATIRKTQGKFEKLISFNLDISYSPIANLKVGKQNNYVSNSVLADGKWLKVGVTKDGIYKIDYNYLKKAGIDVASINPQYLRVYGNGGKQIPFINSISRPDDLIENPIFVFGENDGVLDSTDYLWFFGHGPHYWSRVNDCSGYRHWLHGYSDTSYYFINFDKGPGQRIQRVEQSSSPENKISTSFDDLQFYENEAVNMRLSGRKFYGEKFDNTLSYSFDFSSPNISLNDSAFVKMSVLSISNPSATFNLTCNNSSKSVTPKYAPALGPGATAYTLDIGTEDSVCMKFLAKSVNLNVDVEFVKNSSYSAGYGYLNYIEVVSKRELKMFANQLHFRDFSSVGVSNIVKFQIANAQASTLVLDVTNPTNVFEQGTTINGNSLEFITDYNTLKEYYAFTPGSTTLIEPSNFGVVENQNLHATTPKDMIIIAHSMFLDQANKLKKMHEEIDNLRVIVVTPQQIYNEFSGGAQDLAGLRMFSKMLYDKATAENDIPKYLLLFGDASYITRQRSINGNTNFIPTYESAASLDLIRSYCSDDFFGMLDDTEGEGSTSMLDIAIGRLPSKNVDEANAMVEKITDYITKKPLSNTGTFCPTCQTSSNTVFINGDWRNVITLIADDEDNNLHLGDAESNANIIRQKAKEINVEKIYLDAYKQITDAGGQRYPEVNVAFNERMAKGALIINYSGHGGEVGWALERVLGVDDIKKWSNTGRYPFFVTATCEFTRYDDPSRTSAGELTLLQPNGGGIGLATTTRLVYQSANKELNNTFYNLLFLKDTTTGKYLHLGEVLRLVKNSSNVISTGENSRKFLLIGDPAVRLDYPEYNINTTLIDVLNDSTDTVKALSKVRVKGFISDKNNNKVSSFNGLVYPTVFDKEYVAKTLGNDGSSPSINFKTRKGLIYKGTATVKAGEFSFEFIVPKDIAYQYGKGRISYYAESNSSNADGYFEDFVVGGVNKNAPTDNNGPTVKLYMNDQNFINGSLTNENPKFIALVEDDNGINTTGNGIGHDITAIIDNNTDKSIILNDYYQAELNSYQKGNILYGFNNLSEGSHTISFKVWDVYNNSSNSSIDFVVAQNASIALSHVLNYPNPFTTNTTFMFEHNKPCQSLDVQVQIFSVSGKLIKTINEAVSSVGFRSQEVKWDGLDDYGDKIGKGVYIYKLRVKAADGSYAEQLEKLVLLN